jgi:hypothetical protein
MKLLSLAIGIFLIQSSLIAETCEYEYDSNSTNLTWTAFKFTERTGVNGKFDTINVKGTKKSKTLLGSLEKISFSIPTDSVNSNNPDRDSKIKKYFFGEGKLISGSFSNIDSNGSAILLLKMNNQSRKIPVNFLIKEGKDLEVNLSIDVNDFQLSNGLDALNQVCDELHKGKDGVSKLWPNVDIKINTSVNKVCKN